MKRYWVSWFGQNGVFELHSPWWVSGCTDDADVFCAAVKAESEEDAERVIRDAHDQGHSPDAFRFVDERPDDWSPFNDRFQRRAWMQWSD